MTALRPTLLAAALFLLTLSACEQPPPPSSGPNVAIIDPPLGQRWVPPTPTPAQRAQRQSDENERLQQMEAQLLAEIHAQKPWEIERAQRQAALEAARREPPEALIREGREAAADSGEIVEQQRMDLEQRRRSSAANHVLIAPEGFGPDPNDPLQ